LRKLDLETAIKLRNVIIRRFPEDEVLIKQAEVDVVTILFNFSLFNKTLLFTKGTSDLIERSDLIDRYH